MLILPDGTLFVQLSNFVLFWTLLTFLFIRPTQRAINERQQYIAQLYHDADSYAAEAAALNRTAQQIVGDEARRSEELMRKAAADAARETKVIEKRAAAEAAAAVDRARAEVAAERLAVSIAQQPFVDELARTMADRALGVAQLEPI